MESIVRRSFRPEEYRVNTTPTGTNKPMRWGDKIFVRVRPTSFGQGRGVEFTSYEISDMTSVIGEIRHRLRGERGLWMVYVRNVSRGWSVDRPIKLYRQAHIGAGWMAEEMAKNLEQRAESRPAPRASRITEQQIAVYV
ncbi:MAG: hypothetical protein K2M87_01705 [Muribaculaceae bacterium]|nr:hypothetical protein [Muribaculaceae bacterium]